MTKFAVEKRSVLCKTTKDQDLAVRDQFVVVERATGLVCRWCSFEHVAANSAAEFEKTGY